VHPPRPPVPLNNHIVQHVVNNPSVQHTGDSSAPPPAINSARLDLPVPDNNPIVGATPTPISDPPLFVYHSSDELSEQGDAFLAQMKECAGFVGVEGTAVSRDRNSPTAVAGYESAERFVEKSKKKRMLAHSTISDLYDRIVNLEKGANAAKQAANAANLKIVNLEKGANAAKQGAKAANLKIVNLEKGANAAKQGAKAAKQGAKASKKKIANLDARVKKIELAFNFCGN
jgi:hypothetical protein